MSKSSLSLLLRLGVSVRCLMLHTKAEMIERWNKTSR